MNHYIENYNQGYKIVSLAMNEAVRDDLIEDCLDFLFLCNDTVELYPDRVAIAKKPSDLFEVLKAGNNYDVYELFGDGRFSRVYDDSSVENSFFVTGKCNSNCIMCPSPDYSRKECDIADIDRLIELASHIPADAKHLTITGGEPFMAGSGIFRFLDYLKNKFSNTEFLLLTNGRALAIKDYAKRLHASCPDRLIAGIPIHGSTAALHDYITRADHSFEQTKAGIANLLKLGIPVELRLVVTALNANDLFNMAHMIVSEMQGVDHVCIMAAEMSGNAFVNRGKVWMPYSEAFLLAADAVCFLISSGIDVKLYNFPLCTVSPAFRTLCEKSISPEKIIKTASCSKCSLSDACCGLFTGTYIFEKDDLHPIL